MEAANEAADDQESFNNKVREMVRQSLLDYESSEDNPPHEN